MTDISPPHRHLDEIGEVREIDGVRLWTAIEGEGPTVLMLGGFTAGHNVFELVWPLLRDRFRLVAWEPRGLGESDSPDPSELDYGVDLWAGDLERLVDWLGGEPVLIWAQGFSTYPALRLAARRPDLVRGLVSYTDVWAGDPAKGYAAIWKVYDAIVEGFGTTGPGARMLANLFDVPEPAWFLAWEQVNIERILHPATVPATVGHCLTDADVRDDLAAVRAPVLVLQGDGDWGTGTDDPDPSLALMRERLGSLLETTVIPGAHPGYVLIQRPEACAEAVGAFFERALARAD
jgi:pimeloyl-ACP methyl ester carboxylesterase